jgi:DNA-binding transcriptional regulator YiaG
MPSPYDTNGKAAALARYNAALGHFDDPKVTKIKPKKTAADYYQTRKLKRQALAAEQAIQKAAIKAEERKQQILARTTGRINSMLTRHNQQPLEEVTPPPYDVSKVDRGVNKPPFLAPIKALVRNVQLERHAEQLGDNGISPADFKAWREVHLDMSVDQLAALLRVAGRTVRMWETGKSRIPFALYWAMKHMQRSDLPTDFDESKPTRYAKPVMVDNGRVTLNALLLRNGHLMKEEGITAYEFQQWRLHSMFMSPEQLAQLVRVPVKTVLAWESGKAPIPFSMWWVMHASLQDPEVFLTRPGFHNFYIDYYDGEPMICSRTHPDIRYTLTDLYVGIIAMRSVDSMKNELERQAQRNDELTAENTRLRQMLKAGAVENELANMHEHIGNLLKQMQTADIVSFPEQETVSTVIEFPRQATA